ncbi:hypothetical protein [Epilithonimonas sp.]|uniref:hypothetical protein n=1 Tax=Epilithonimonas sp. TaxID=2894511 RepID=UPI0028A1C4DA|nr:hypothetical protein [Epilithonimonas sp.]
MNFDDKFTKEFEEKFEKNLEAIRSMPPGAHQQIKESLNVISEFVEKLKNKSEKTSADLELLANLQTKLKRLYETFSDMQLILGESLHRKSLAFYENVKKLAKEGDEEAEKIYNELKIHIEKFDSN